MQLTVNGEDVEVHADPRWTLLDLVRDGLGLKGTHAGCRTGDCGACTVRLDGAIVKSCLVLAGRADGGDVRTIEGLAPDGELSGTQEAFWAEYGFQCGFCLPGMLFAADDLLDRVDSPTDADIRSAIDGNLCRCTGYVNVVRAVHAAADAREVSR